MSRERIMKCCEVTTKYLRYCFIFPEDGKDNSPSYKAKILAVFFSICLLFIGTFIHCILAIRNHHDVEIITFDIVVLISCTGVLWINGLFYKNRHLIIELARSISDFDLFGKPPGYEKFNRALNFYAKLHLLYVMSGSLCYFIIFAPLHNKKCQKLNLEKNLTEICSLFLPIYVPVSQLSLFVSFPVLHIVNTVQFSILMISYTTCGSILWINVECVEHICFRIGHLKSTFLLAFREKGERKRRKMFNRAIDYHNEVLRMGSLVDNFFGVELFLHVILTGAILGCCAFVMIDTHSMDTFMLFIGWLNAIIMGCVSGQRLINESLAISDVLNEVPWQNYDISLKKDILFFVLRCKKPMRIRAGNVTMTNNLIIEILRTAYSYLTLLSSFNKVNED